MNVKKRNGYLEPVDIDKINRVVEWACEGLDNVSVSEIELKSQIHMSDGIETSVIHSLLIKSAADLISETSPDYQYVASRLDTFQLRKEVYGGYEPPEFNQFVRDMVSRKLYDRDLVEKYADAERIELGKVINHDNDLKFSYAATQQWAGKYFVQDRVTKEIFETPQMAYMAIAMCFFQEESKDIRLNLVKEFYQELTEGRISLPTPIMGGLRTPTRQFSSCVTLEADDSLDSINATSSAIVKYISQRAGIGLNFGKIRALYSKIRGGEAKHTGVIPFLKHFQTAVKSTSQGSIRGGAATAFYPMWHLEVKSLLVLKNNRGVEENRVRQLDYGVQLNKTMYQRLITKGNITLFSPSDVDGLYEAFFADQDKFEELYTKYENDPSIRKETVSAVELFTIMLQERAQTGRIYIMNVDHSNTHSSFTDTVRHSNLCVTGDTKILTRDGYKPIEELAGQTVECWNGKEWSMTPLFRTSDNEPIYMVELSNGMKIGATGYHKWYVGDDNKETRTVELNVNDTLTAFQDPYGLEYSNIKVKSVTFTQTSAPVYCGTEPKRNRLMFNGVLTGNCLEITLPTTPLNYDRDPDGEIALCTLAAFNLGADNLEERLERSAYLITRALDNLLDYQDYPVKAAEKAMYRRSLGIGVTNYAYWLAKNGLYYSNGSGNNATHRLFEHIQYSLIKASIALAKEKGACGYYNRTKYSQGLLPIDHYKKEVDSIHTQPLLCDWESLREDLIQYGMRNSTLTAQMPCETSSQITNSTNGIEPPRGLVSIKGSKDGVFKQVVPNGDKYHYELLWDIPSNQGYLELVAIMQKFIDQSISANTNYDPERFDGGKVPMNQLIKDLVLAYKLGIKTLYYHNTRDGSGDGQHDDGCASGACKL
jgi:ribonucleotide reductase alpha subunit